MSKVLFFIIICLLLFFVFFAIGIKTSQGFSNCFWEKDYVVFRHSYDPYKKVVYHRSNSLYGLNTGPYFELFSLLEEKRYDDANRYIDQQLAEAEKELLLRTEYCDEKSRVEILMEVDRLKKNLRKAKGK